MHPKLLLLPILLASCSGGQLPEVSGAPSPSASVPPAAAQNRARTPPDPVALAVEQEAIVAHQRGDRVGEMRALERLVQLRPDYLPPRMFLAESLVQDGLHDAALVHLDAALALGGRDPHVHVLRAKALLLRGRLPEAYAALTAADQIEPTAGAGVVRARLLLLERQLPVARRQLEDVLTRWPDSLPAAVAFGELLRREGDLAGSRRRLEDVVSRPGADALAHYELAMTLRALGKNAEARAALTIFQRLSAGHNAAVAGTASTAAQRSGNHL